MSVKRKVIVPDGSSDIRRLLSMPTRGCSHAEVHRQSMETPCGGLVRGEGARRSEIASWLEGLFRSCSGPVRVLFGCLFRGLFGHEERRERRRPWEGMEERGPGMGRAMTSLLLQVCGSRPPA